MSPGSVPRARPERRSQEGKAAISFWIDKRLRERVRLWACHREESLETTYERLIRKGLDREIAGVEPALYEVLR